MMRILGLGLAVVLLSCGSTQDSPTVEPESSEGSESEGASDPVDPEVGADETESDEPTPQISEQRPVEVEESEPRGCRRGSCPQGQMCFGPQGCDQPWTCQPMRRCTRDLVTYCGCDGRQFRSSGSCPERPYSARGACGASAP